MKASLLSTGIYVPKEKITSVQLERKFSLEKGWIEKKTGIRLRHIGQETSAQMGTKAALCALRKIRKEDIDLLIVATSTPDRQIPSTACLIAHAIGLRCAAFDVDLDCAGFVCALIQATQAIETGRAKKVLVIGTEQYSRLLDWNDPKTCILFGDGAGAVVLGAGKKGISKTYLQCGGDPSVIETSSEEKFTMRGHEVYGFAVNAIFTSVKKIMDPTKLDLIIPHQSNKNILKDAAIALDVPFSKIFCNIERYGNTAAASVAIALHEANVKKGDKVCLVAYGAGPAWGSVLLEV